MSLGSKEDIANAKNTIKSILDSALAELPTESTFADFMQFCSDRRVLVMPNSQISGKKTFLAGVSYKFDGNKIQANKLGGEYYLDALFVRFGGDKYSKTFIDEIKAVEKKCAKAISIQSKLDSGSAKSISAEPSEEKRQYWLEKARKIGRLKKFKFTKSPSYDFLHQALSEYIRRVEPKKDNGPYIGKMYIDDSATGTGKSWAISGALAEMVSHLPFGRNVLLLAPENRHLKSIAKDLDKALDGAWRHRVIRLRRNEELILDHPIPQGCPFQQKALKNDPLTSVKNAGKYAIARLSSLADELAKTIESIENLAKSSENLKSSRSSEEELKNLKSSEEYLVKKIGEERDALMSNCKTLITATANSGNLCRSCASCYTMFPGNALKSSGNPNIVIATYQKFVRGFGAFDILEPHSEAGEPKKNNAVFYRFHPASKYKKGSKRGIFDTFILMEEASQGKRIIENIIEEEASNLSVIDAARLMHADLNSTTRQVLRNLKHEAPEFYEKHVDSIMDRIQKAKDDIESYYVSSEECRPYRSADGGLQLKKTSGPAPSGSTQFKRFVSSLSSGFSSLFASASAGIKPIEHERVGSFVDDQVMASIEVFDSYGKMRSSGYSPLNSTIGMLIECAIKPAASIAAELKYISIDINKKVKTNEVDYCGQFLDLFKRKNYGDHSISVGEFIEALIQRTSNKLKGGNLIDHSILSQFYREGYEFIEARDSKFKTVDILLRVSNGSPEGIVENLRNCGNDIYASSASAKINSLLTNFDMDWLKRSTGDILQIPREDIRNVLREKIDGKPIPEIIWSDSSVQPIIDIDRNIEKNPNVLRDIVSTLNSLAIDLYNNGETAVSPRFGIIFFNDKSTLDKAKMAFDKFARSHLADGVLDNEGCLKTYRVTAEEFKSGKVDEIKRRFVEHLLDSDPIQYFLVFTTYPSMKTGANMHVDIPYLPDTDANFWRYVGSNIIRQHESEEYRVSVDISDLVLSEPISSVVNESNVWRVAHHLYAVGDIDWMVASHNLISNNGDVRSNYQRMSSLVKRTNHFVAVQADDITQASGRMDRTLNSSTSPKLFLTESLLGIFSRVSGDITKDAVLSPVMRTILESALDVSALRPSLEFDDVMVPIGVSCRDFQKQMSMSFRKGDAAPAARALWEMMRKLFTRYQAFYGIDLSGFRDIRDLDAAMKAYDSRLAAEDLFFKIPTDMIRRGWDKSIDVSWKQSEDTVTFREPDHPIDSRVSMMNADGDASAKWVYVLRPSLYSDIAMPANFEKIVENRLVSWVRVNPLKADEETHGFGRVLDMDWLFERADIFVPELDLAVDAKMYSHLTMSLHANEASITDFLDTAHAKLDAMRNEAPEGRWYPTRYVYAFKNRFGNMHLEAYFKGNTPVQADADWDVAFIDTQCEKSLRQVKRSIKGHQNHE